MVSDEACVAGGARGELHADDSARDRNWMALRPSPARLQHDAAQLFRRVIGTDLARLFDNADLQIRVTEMSIPAVHPQRVLIAGGSCGIGLAIAEAFVRNGAHVSLCARNTGGLAQAAHALAPHGTPSHTFACDLSDAAQIQAYVQAAA